MVRTPRICRALSPVRGMVVGSLAALAILATGGGGPVVAAPFVAMSGSHATFLNEHCGKCHSAARQEGQVRLDDMPSEVTTVEQAERWQKVLNVLNSGQMPPEDEPQPASEEKLRFLEVLSREMVSVRATLGDAGGRMVMRRLNRREYAATIRDLLGVEVNVNDLPTDVGTGGFDTVGSTLFVSADQVEKYLEIGREAIRRAIAGGPRPAVQRVRFEPESREQDRSWSIQVWLDRERDGHERYLKWQADPSKPVTDFGFKHESHAKFAKHCWDVNHKAFETYLGLPLSHSGSYLMLAVAFRSKVEITVPADVAAGDYVLRVRAGHLPGSPRARQFIDLVSNPIGDRFLGRHMAAFRVAATTEAPGVYEIPFHLEPDSDRVLTLTEKRNHRADFNWKNSVARTELLKPELTPGDPHRAMPSLWIDWVEWEGPLPTPGTAEPYDHVFTRGPDEPSSREYGREIIELFIAKAFRGRQPDHDFVERVVAFRERQEAEGRSFNESLIESLAVVLASPSFLYLAEPVNDVGLAAAEGRRPLSDREFAVRLAYFLWGGPPDDQLLLHASSGALRSTSGLASEVDRMLDDPRSQRFVEGFVSQWLHLNRLDFFQFDVRQHEAFDDATKQSARDQLFATVQWILDANESARHLLDSREAVVNEVLADYYGIPDEAFQAGSPCRDDAWRRLTLPAGSPRGGLLGTAAVLAMGSNGKRTSPVERGAFVLRKLLDQPPPPAPANVPQLSRLDGKPMAARARLAAHMEQAQCAYCHRTIDPPGFALEHFDAVGRWRDQELDPANRRWPIDATGRLPDGTEFQGADELKAVLVERAGGFVRGLTRSLFEYAVGRPVGFTDTATLDALVVQCRADDDRLRTLVHAIVAHPAFALK
jgi:hypothetical protein